MRFNLIPDEKRKGQENYRGYKEAFLLVLIAAYLTGGVCRYMAGQERDRFAAQSLPIQGKIIRQNQLEKKLRDLSEQIGEKKAKQVRWAELLVMLSDTKPEAVQAKKLIVWERVLSISGYVTDSTSEQKWQDILRRQPGIQSVSVSRLKVEKDAVYPEFKMEVEFAEQGNRADTGRIE